MSSQYLSLDKTEPVYKYRVEIQQMMFVSGDIQNSSILLTNMIEDIVREEVVKILKEGLILAVKRKTYSNASNENTSNTASSNIPPLILPEDIIFLMRHDKSQVARLRTYLSWKELRKNSKDQDKDKAGGSDMKEGDDKDKDSKDKDKDSKDQQDIKRATINLPWELQFMFSEQPLTNDSDDDDDEYGSNQMDDLDTEEFLKSQKKLKQADERTLKMSKEEYVHWSECRQASFTFRKAKRFKEWCNYTKIQEQMGFNPNGAGGGKLTDDVVDILGFLTFDIVCNITELGIKILKQEEFLLKSQLETSERGLFGKNNMLLELDLRPRHIIRAWKLLRKIRFGKSCIRNFSGGRLKNKKIVI
ncbi:TFIID-18kDa-domain-containing protein [Hanseniaspora valbyensis NRRL Y-1626]|uniref:TFIID-18kDa-domain-containing protein n=1 Tax=Hanseniaspora valbyensis NRRL Y-1626 TaxID=766949 RepID=A0A1B7TAM4_9ASCO|nr:TFIID-18kDa-domain-containing protein [Hanseniaspora valbyensis NRRL Y-1626]